MAFADVVFAEMQTSIDDVEQVRNALFFAYRDGHKNKDIAAAIKVRAQTLSAFKTGKGHWSPKNHEALKAWLISNGYAVEPTYESHRPDQAKSLVEFAGQQLIGLGHMLIELDEPLEFKIQLLEQGLKVIDSRILPALKEKLGRSKKGE